MHSRCVTEMQRHAIGIPKVAMATDLNTCPVCAAAKIKKAAHGKEDSRHANVCGQGISIDMVLMVQASSADSKWVERLKGINGETSYCLITNHKSAWLYGECSSSKAPPLGFMNWWLLQHGCSGNVPDEYVRMDLGSELSRARGVNNCFEKAGYKIKPTTANSSHQNGPGKRPHETIADGIQAMLGGANLLPMFWPYAFHHFIRLYNVTIHCGFNACPFEICTGQKPNL